MDMLISRNSVYEDYLLLNGKILNLTFVLYRAEEQILKKIKEHTTQGKGFKRFSNDFF